MRKKQDDSHTFGFMDGEWWRGREENFLFRP
jgi:hypothetical protein